MYVIIRFSGVTAWIVFRVHLLVDWVLVLIRLEVSRQKLKALHDRMWSHCVII